MTKGYEVVVNGKQIQPIMSEFQRLFVYGTLAPGEKNHNLLADLNGNWERATIKGHFHETGWGYTEGFPGLVLDPEGETVSGFLFTSNELSTCWERLDEFEGEEYCRVLTAVRSKKNEEVEAFVYVVRC